MKMDTTHESAVTQFIDAHGVHYAFRRIGPSTGTPIVFRHRFRGTMDDWDPTVINGFAKERSVILFEDAGIGLSTGTTPSSVKGMAEHAVNFVGALVCRRSMFWASRSAATWRSGSRWIGPILFAASSLSGLDRVAAKASKYAALKSAKSQDARRLVWKSSITSSRSTTRTKRSSPAGVIGIA